MSDGIRRITKDNQKLVYILSFCMLFVLCYLFPYTMDDWSWGSNVGLERLQTGFSGYGGRYLGYMIVILMSQSNFVRALIMSLVIVGICICIERIVCKKWAFFVALLLIFTVAELTFSQSIVWTSGFSNYTVSTFLLLIFLLYYSKNRKYKKNKTLFVHTIALSILGFASALIVENVSLCCVIISIIFQIHYLKNNKKISIPILAYCIFSIIGCLWMFSNSAYTNVANGTDFYRDVSLSTSIIVRSINNFKDVIYPYGIFRNITLILFVNSIWLLKITNDIKKKKYTKTSGVILTVLTVFSISSVFNACFVTEKNKYIILFEAIISILFILVNIYYTLQKNSKHREELMLYWATFFVLIAPLFVVSPINPRCMFTPYIILIIINLKFFSSIIDSIPKKRLPNKTKNILNKLIYTSCITLWFLYVGFFLIIFNGDRGRLDYIRKQYDIGEKEIELKKLPFNSVIWCATPESKLFQYRYLLFNNLPKDIKLKVENKDNCDV